MLIILSFGMWVLGLGVGVVGVFRGLGVGVGCSMSCLGIVEPDGFVEWISDFCVESRPSDLGDVECDDLDLGTDVEC